MTVLEALVRADLARPNEIEQSQKLQWLSALDGQIHAELLEAYRGAPEPFSGYNGQTELRTAQLLVPFPYDELYLRYLVMRIDLEQGELERYNNDAACFNRLWQSCAAHYGRTHEPLTVPALRF